VNFAKMMKYFAMTVLFAVGLLQFNCDLFTESSGKDVFVKFDIEFAFQNDSIRLLLDNKILVETNVTTNYTVSLAWSSGLQKLTSGNHIVRFFILNRGIQGQFSFFTSFDTSTVAIRLAPQTNQLSFQYFKGVLLRD